MILLTLEHCTLGGYIHLPVWFCKQLRRGCDNDGRTRSISKTIDYPEAKWLQA